MLCDVWKVLLYSLGKCVVSASEGQIFSGSRRARRSRTAFCTGARARGAIACAIHGLPAASSSTPLSCVVRGVNFSMEALDPPPLQPRSSGRRAAVVAV